MVCRAPSVMSRGAALGARGRMGAALVVPRCVIDRRRELTRVRLAARKLTRGGGGISDATETIALWSSAMASSLGPTLVRCDPPALVVTGEVPTAPPLPRLDAAVPLPASEEVLRAVLPPRVHTADGKTWVSAAATTPATRGDVAALADALDARLRQQGARDFGVCPVREELYAQAFGEPGRPA